jgi:transcriptional regulator GlxA family with amidase domain
MRKAYPRVDVREALLVDRGGTLVTGGGVSLCIDTTLYLLGLILGERVADETARIMEYQRARRANRDGFAPVLTG